MTKIHYIVAFNKRYAEWCCLSVNSLLTRGKVKKEDIVISMQEPLRNTPAASVLASFGVTMEFYEEAHWSKFLFIDKLLKKRGVSRVVQLDCDCVLTEDMDLMKELSMLRGKHVFSYVSKADPSATIARREKLFLPNFNPNSDIGGKRLDSLLESLFGFSLREFQESSTGWVYGGVIIVDKPVTQLQVWKSLITFSWICRCDELTLMLGINSKSGFRWGSIPKEVLDHRVNPKVLDLNSGKGFIHFAGDWYRITNEGNRKILEDSFESLLKRLA